MKNASKTPVNVLETHIPLQEATINDALLLSEALNLNELASVELVLAAEHQIPLYPGEFCLSFIS